MLSQNIYLDQVTLLTHQLFYALSDTLNRCTGLALLLLSFPMDAQMTPCLACQQHRHLRLLPHQDSPTTRGK